MLLLEYGCVMFWVIPVLGELFGLNAVRGQGRELQYQATRDNHEWIHGYQLEDSHDSIPRNNSPLSPGGQCV